MRVFAGELVGLLLSFRPAWLCMLAFQMDESADPTQEKIYVVSGFLGLFEVWHEADRQWSSRLARSGLGYFKTNEYNTLRGEFRKLVYQYGRVRAREIADELLEDLWLILKSMNLLGFCFLGPMPVFRSVGAEPYSKYVFQTDPFIHAYEQIIYHVAAWVTNAVKPPDQVVFIFDEHSKGNALMGRWLQLKSTSPIAAPVMASLAPANDKQCPAIQMADLLASTARSTFEGRLHDCTSALEDLKKKCGQNLTWVGIWTEDYLRELRDVSIDSATRPVAPLAIDFNGDGKTGLTQCDELKAGLKAPNRGPDSIAQ